MAAAHPSCDDTGVRVDSDTGGGGIGGSSLIAARSFTAGEVVLCEQPKFLLLDAGQLVCGAPLLEAVAAATELGSDNELTVYIARIIDLWLQLDTAQRGVMLSCFSTPDDDSMTEFMIGLAGKVQQALQLGGAAEVGTQGGALSDHGEVASALMAWLLSTHEVGSSEPAGSGDGGKALYYTGHRANHSCDPNVAYQPTPDHALVFRALRPIAQGEPLQFSYLLSHELLAPCAVRRRLCMERKYFHCRCDRCTATDAAPEPQVAEEDEALVDEALAGTLQLTPELRARRETELLADWLCAAAVWSEGYRLLRTGVETSQPALSKSGWPLLTEYFAWAEQQQPQRSCFVSSQAASAYACLVHTQQPSSPAGATLICQLCGPRLHALECEYGADDVHNVAIRAFVLGHCAYCGAEGAELQRCEGCRLASYCNEECRRQNWSEQHQLACERWQVS